MKNRVLLEFDTVKPWVFRHFPIPSPCFSTIKTCEDHPPALPQVDGVIQRTEAPWWHGTGAGHKVHPAAGSLGHLEPKGRHGAMVPSRVYELYTRPGKLTVGP